MEKLFIIPLFLIALSAFAYPISGFVIVIVLLFVVRENDL